MKQRPAIIRNWREVEPPGPVKPLLSGEAFGFVADLSGAVGLSHLRVGHFRLRPGERSNPPIVMRDMEVFVFVLEGTPDLFVDGHVYRLAEGHGVCLDDRTGIAQSFLNNSGSDARLFIFSEPMLRNMKARHPLPGDEAADDNLRKMGLYWADAPRHKLGPHDGLTDLGRGKPGPRGARKRKLPDFVVHWRDILESKEVTYPHSKETHGCDAPFGKRARFSRIGVHVEQLKPGRRTSWPHAERDEEEFVFVVSGHVDCWLDGRITPMWAGDLVGWEAGTGLTHVVINNSNEDAILIVGGEASRARNQFWYPFHPARNRDIGALYWKDHPVPRLGSHDGLPEILRERLPAASRRSAVAANAAAKRLEMARVRKKRKTPTR
ncbi:MAG TPA: cupin domain-containing protein [Rhizomicrobium sp.]|nr:cupin domain-containing protein [Rhizomicrobium sp.]